MAGPASRRSTKRSFDLLARGLDAPLDAPDEEPDLETILLLIQAATGKAELEARKSKDARADVLARGAAVLEMRATQLQAEGKHEEAEDMAVSALDQAIYALRYALEIKAGLCQPLTDAQSRGRDAVNTDLTHLGEDERREVEACIAAWRARPSWEPPVGRDLRRRQARVNGQLEWLLDQLRVSRWVRHWLDARQERSRRKLQDQAPSEDLPDL